MSLNYVDKINIDNDIKNFSKAILQIMNLTSEQHKSNAINARKCLDKFRPELIKKKMERRT